MKISKDTMALAVYQIVMLKLTKIIVMGVLVGFMPAQAELIVQELETSNEFSESSIDSYYSLEDFSYAYDNEADQPLTCLDENNNEVQCSTEEFISSLDNTDDYFCVDEFGNETECLSDFNEELNDEPTYDTTDDMMLSEEPLVD